MQKLYLDHNHNYYIIILIILINFRIYSALISIQNSSCMNGTLNMITFTIITMASSLHFSFHFLIVILNLPFFVSFFDPSITLAGGAAPFPIHPPSSSVIDFACCHNCFHHCHHCYHCRHIYYHHVSLIQDDQIISFPVL